MHPSNVDVVLRSWNRYVVEGLAVSPDVIGRQHSFKFGDAEIEIQLPSKDAADRDSNSDSPIAKVSSWWSADGSPIDYDVYKIDVIVRLKRSMPLPAKVLDVNANAFDLIPEGQQDTLENLCEEHGCFAERAVERWLSVLRWITDDYRIARPYFTSGGDDWNVRLFDEATQKKVWIQSSTAHVRGHHRVTLDEWLNAEIQLAKQEVPPIHISLKHDAEKFLAVGDRRRAIIDMAVSCETFLRHVIRSTLPSELNVSARNFIEEANIRRYIDNFLPSALMNDAAEHYKRQIKPALTLLFEQRNEVMHQAINVSATTEDCNRILQALNMLFGLVPSGLK